LFKGDVVYDTTVDILFDKLGKF